MTDAELDCIEACINEHGHSLSSTSLTNQELCALVAEVRRLRGVRVADAELEAIRERNEYVKGRDERIASSLAVKFIDTLLAHIDFLTNTVIADLRADLANENQWAAGFRACREMAVDVCEAYGVTADAIAALTPEDYAARTRTRGEGKR